MKAYVCVIIGLLLVSLNSRSTFLFNRSLLFHNSMLFAAFPWIYPHLNWVSHIKFHISGGLGLILHTLQALVSTADIAQLLAVALLHISENIMLISNYSFPTACVWIWLCVCVWERERLSQSSQPAQRFRALLTINKHLYIFPFRKTYLLTLNIFSICFPSDSGKRRGEGRRRRENNLLQFPLTLSLSGKMEAGLFARTSMPTSNWYYTYVSVVVSFGEDILVFKLQDIYLKIFCNMSYCNFWSI